MALFREKTAPESPSPAAPPPAFRDDICPQCKGDAFTPGGPVVSVRSNGAECRVDQSGAVLSCLQCGARWYTTPQGLRAPHELALPPAWAMADMQAKARAEQHNRAQERSTTPRKAMTGPASGFAMPPRVT